MELGMVSFEVSFLTCWMVLESLGGLSRSGIFPNNFHPGTFWDAVALDSLGFQENKLLKRTKKQVNTFAIKLK